MKSTSCCANQIWTTTCFTQCKHRYKRHTAVFCQAEARHERQDTAEQSSIGSRQESVLPVSPQGVRLPKSGYLSLADPKEAVYVKDLEPFNPNKRGGRYKSDFIWNTNWQQQLDRSLSLEKQAEHEQQQQQQQAKAEAGRGFVGLSRRAELDDISMDMTEQLVRSRADREQEEPNNSVGKDKPSSNCGFATTRDAAKKFSKPTRRLAARGSPTSSSLVIKDAERKALETQEANERYSRLKQDFQSWTVAVATCGFAVTYTSCDGDTAVSYLVGSLAGLLYLRLLGRSVDSIGGSHLNSSMAGHPRMLVPLILVLSYNRWNALWADESGIKLNLLAMLAGFFAYKLAVIARQAKDVLDDANNTTNNH